MSDEAILKIKELSIIEIAKKLGIKVLRNKALCYKEHDTAPSLSFVERKGIFKCFGCGDSGDQITLVMKALNINFMEAMNWFHSEYQINITKDKRQSNKIRKQIVKSKLNKTEVVQFSNPDIFESLINSLSLSETALKYLVNERGFSEQTIQNLDIKDIPNPELIFQNLKNKWGVDALVQCGLCKINDLNAIKNVWWDHVIIFPFLDLNYRVQYLQARRFANDKYGKYINLSLKPYPYNLQTLNKMNEGDKLYICEGIPDAMTLIQRNINAIAILGANNFDMSFVDILSRYRIYVIPDRDNGGQVFLSKIQEAFNSIGKQVQEIKIPKPNNDLNEFFVKQNSGL